MNFVSVELAGVNSVHPRMPDKFVTILQLNDIGRLAIRFVEEQEKDLARVLGVNGEIHCVRQQCRAKWKVFPRLDHFRGAMFELVRHLCPPFSP